MDRREFGVAAATGLAAVAALGQDQKKDPQQGDVPKGEVLKFTFNKSKIFPGTTRDYWVYIPKQYDGKTPACVHVNQDGIQFKAPEVFDRLIHEKKIPVLIGVFIMHGRVPAPDDSALDRYNRSYEYDGLGDAYVRFLLEEILPEVETKKASDGREIKLSKNGNDRSIGGTSSGAICAFTAAWERPDAFSRVFSGIGTYVGLRGGDRYTTLVRKAEPKPIRIFMEDGDKDLNIYGGDWWMANQSLQRSLQFAGYEVKHVWGTGGHNNEHATKLFPEGMTWLWADHPKPVKAGLGNPTLKNILLPGEEWKLVGEGYKFTEGPAVNAKGEVFFNDVPSSKTYKVGLDGKVSVFLEDSKKGDGAAFGPDGRLYMCSGGESKILAFKPDGSFDVIADGFRGNDLVVRHDGTVFATNPGWDGKEPSKIWTISPKGEKKSITVNIKFTNGITLSPDQTLLYVADSRSHWVHSFQIQKDGTLAFQQKYFHLHAPDTADDTGVDGLRTDRAGFLYAATNMGIQIADQPGRVHCIIPTPNKSVSNFTFGGEKFDHLYAMCRDKVYVRKVKAMGAISYMAPIKPPKPGL